MPKNVKCKKSEPIYLEAAERRLAAMFLATSNLGMPEPRSAEPAVVERAWRECVDAHAAEGLSVQGEFREWLRLLNAGDAFCAEEWRRLQAGKGA